MDIVTFAIVVVLSISVWIHNEKIDTIGKRIDKIEQSDSLKNENTKLH
jgi:hypothetical protein